MEPTSPLTGSPAPLSGRCGAKLRASDPPRYCKQFPLKDRQRCKLHGGTSLAGPAAPGWRTGAASKYLPKGLVASFEASMQDPDLLALDRDISVVQARIEATLGQLRDGGNEGWSAVRKAVEAVDAATTGTDKAAAAVALVAVVRKGLDAQDLWTDLERLTEQKRRLVDTERRRIEAAQQALTTERATALITYVLESLKRNVRDRAALVAVTNDLRTLLTGHAA